MGESLILPEFLYSVKISLKCEGKIQGIFKHTQVQKIHI